MGIETAIGTALVAAGVGGTATTGVAGTLAAGIVAVGGSLISTGISIGLGRLFAPDQPNAPPLNPASTQNVQQATPRERYAYGTAIMGGAICFAEAKPPYIVYQYMLAAHECEEIAGVIVNGQVCQFNANGDAITPFFNKNGTSYLKISVRRGLADQPVDPLLLDEFPDTDPGFRQRGICTVTLRAYYGANAEDHEETWGVQQFNPQFIVKGRKIFDPRDRQQSRDDPSTWTWSDNWALCLADWARAPFGARLRPEQIDYDFVAEMADICDRSVALFAGGSERQWTLNGSFLSSDNPFQVLNDMLSAAGRGAVLFSSGKFRPLPDYVRQPVATITEADLAGGFDYVNAKPRGEVLNLARTEFRDPENDYKPDTTPKYERADLVARDGQEFEALVSRPFVHGQERAQRHDQIEVERSRLGKSLSIAVSIRKRALEPGDLVNVQFDRFERVSGLYTIATRRRGEGVIELELAEDDPARVLLWDPATDYREPDVQEAA